MTAAFLQALAQVLAAESLYGTAHPSTQRALEAACARMDDMLSAGRTRTITFLGGEVLADEEPIEAMRDWPWARRLAAVQIERIEFDADARREDLDRLIEDILSRLSSAGGATAERRQTAAQRIRYGSISVKAGGDAPESIVGVDVEPAPRVELSLADETSTVQWLHAEARTRERLPMAEVDAVVRSLGLAMRTERRLLLPLLDLRTFDEYTTTHALNVAMLSMGLAEQLGLRPDEVRAIGTAGLLHDLGKICIPLEILTKPGRLTDDERRIMNRHPIEGARLVLQKESSLELAAVVAYEHHICLDGTGYPDRRFPRASHYASRIVHVCDIYDALCTHRPYREAWSSARALAYLQERAGTELDPTIVDAFVVMVQGALLQRAPVGS